ncbi:MAG: AAA family ATPase [Minicystis sp.]
MRIDTLLVENFKGFARRELSFHPQFNLVVGENGTGKTSVLDALSVAAGLWIWLLGVGRYEDSRRIRNEDVRLQSFVEESGVHWERQFPCSVEVRGEIAGETLRWRRRLKRANAPRSGASREVRALAERVGKQVQEGARVVLPLIGYYGTGRLSGVPLKQTVVSGETLPTEKSSRLTGYEHSVDRRLSVRAFVAWIARQSWLAFQQGGKATSAYEAVRAALVRNVQDARDVSFDAKLGEVVVEFEGGERQPFGNLSDGQRSMLALVGDVAQRAATLNPHLNGRVLEETPGVVLIDELDLHLHPKWQRHVIEDLRSTFPAIQFICTTHSPFLIQSLRSGEELVMLDGQPTAQLGNLSVEDIARGIQGVANPEVSARYEEMKGVARGYLETLEEAAKAPEDKLAAYEQRLAESVAPYAERVSSASG